jgi:flagellar hook-length control protein FliK
MVNGGEQSATLTLNPPDLGPLQVVLSVSNDQASVAFTAAQPEVREALEQALPKLRETMGEAGITLGDTSVSAGSQEQQQAFAEMAAAGRGRGVANGNKDNGQDADDAGQTAPQVRRSLLGAVDTFA